MIYLEENDKIVCYKVNIDNSLTQIKNYAILSMQGKSE